MALFSAIPVRMPGSAIGSTSTNETAFRPKKRNRCTAIAARLPNKKARSVAMVATSSDVPSAVRTREFCHARV
jgi:hypothetical protein